MRAIIFSLLTIFSTHCFSADVVIYINGIQNTRIDAQSTSDKIYDLMRSAPERAGLTKPTKYISVWNKIGYFGNTPSLLEKQNSLNEDLDELFVSKNNEENYALQFNKILLPHNNLDVYLDKTSAQFVVDRMQFELSSIRHPIDQLFEQTKKQIDSGNRVIIVAHSQGNIIANFVWAKLIVQYENALKTKVRVVNVANTTRRSPNNLNFTHAGDAALFKRADVAACPEQSLEYLPIRKSLPRKTPVCYSGSDSSVCQFFLAPATFKASNSGSGSVDSGDVVGGGIDACLDHSIVATYMSNADVNVEIDQGIEFSSSKSFSKRMEDFIFQAIKSLNDSQKSSPIITSPLYERYTGATGEACYSRQIGTQKSAGVYTLSNSQYCRSGGQWVNVTGADNERYLDTQGNLYPFSAVEIKDTGNNTYTAGYGGSTIWNISYTQKSAGTYSQTLRAVSDYYSVDFDPNSYIYNNVEEFAILLYRYNTSSTNTGYLSSGGTVGFLFEGPSTTSGSVKYFSINDPNRSAINTGAWTRKAMGANTEIIELDEKSTLLNSYPDSSLRKIYYRGSSAGVREGNKTLTGRVDSGDLLDRNTINAIFASEGLPATPN
jgi:hypothetical protein